MSTWPCNQDRQLNENKRNLPKNRLLPRFLPILLLILAQMHEGIQLCFLLFCMDCGEFWNPKQESRCQLLHRKEQLPGWNRTRKQSAKIRMRMKRRPRSKERTTIRTTCMWSGPDTSERPEIAEEPCGSRRHGFSLVAYLEKLDGNPPANSLAPQETTDDERNRSA